MLASSEFRLSVFSQEAAVMLKRGQKEEKAQRYRRGLTDTQHGDRAKTSEEETVVIKKDDSLQRFITEQPQYQVTPTDVNSQK